MVSTASQQLELQDSWNGQGIVIKWKLGVSHSKLWDLSNEFAGNNTGDAEHRDWQCHHV